MGANPKGRAGEDYAAEKLREWGYRVLDRNVHSRWGEVDIVALKEDVICFVEVKTRKRDAAVPGALSVGPAKQRKILRTAVLYLQAHPELDLQPRFDLFLVETGAGGGIRGHDYIEGAFDGAHYE